jgi:sarcosine oxidase, subunit beta
LETLGGTVSPDSYDTSVSFDEISQFSDRTARTFPIMASKGELSTSFTGLYDNTPDEQPIIDNFSDIGFENLYCCVGLSGHGFKLSPEFGRILSTLLAGEKFSDYDISIFAKRRFEEGKLIKSRYQAATIG